MNNTEHSTSLVDSVGQSGAPVAAFDWESHLASIRTGRPSHLITRATEGKRPPSNVQQLLQTRRFVMRIALKFNRLRKTHVEIPAYGCSMIASGVSIDGRAFGVQSYILSSFMWRVTDMRLALSSEGAMS